jgi:hypothetical protein
MTVPDDRAARAVPRGLLLAGLAAGALMAAIGLRAAPGPALPPEAVARVADRLILREAWQRAIAAVAADRRTPLTAADERHILERLVDEELLVQHGVALGLVENDARLRSTLVSEVMQAATQAARAEPDEAQLRAFHDAQPALFAPAARLRVRAWRVDAAGARAPFEPRVPDTLLPVAALRTYLGPTLARRALALAPGAVDPGTDGVVLEVLEAQPAAAPPFEQIRAQVRGEFLRRADERAVRELLAQLRQRTPIAIVDAAASP